MIYIYLYTNRITNEHYVGQTSNFMRRRWEHKSCSGGCRKFHQAIEKYGYDNFDFELLDKGEDDEKDWNEVELYYINKYESNVDGKGYNMLKPCISKNRNKMGENISNSLRGRKLTDDAKERISKHQKRTGIYVDDIYFDSIADASKYFGFDRRCLAYCLKHNQIRTYKGHKIEYKEEYEISNKHPMERLSKGCN